MKPTQVTTRMRINRQDAEDILLDITANFTPAAGNEYDDGPLVEDIKAKTAEPTISEDVLLYEAGRTIDLTEDEEQEAVEAIQQQFA